MQISLALAQIDSQSGQRAQNMAQHLAAIEQAKAQRADIVVFPEYSMSGSPQLASARDEAVDVHHADIHALATASQGVTSLVSGLEQHPAGMLFNTAFVLRDGEVVTQHRKLNIPTYGNLVEGKFFAAGDRLTTFSLDHIGYTAGVMICADSWNPGLVYAQALTGCQLLLQPVSSALNAVEGEYDNPGGWQTNIQHTAMTWGMFVVMVNRVGEDGGMRFYGQSSVIDPYGKRLLQMDAQPGVQSVKMDLAETAVARFNLPTLRDAAPDQVQALIAAVMQEGGH